MTARPSGPALVVVLVVALGVVLASARDAAAELVAEPAVQVIDAAAGGTGSGTIVLRNTGGETAVVGSITVEPGCATGSVHAAPLAGFMLAPGATRAISISCTAAPAGMQRCGYRVRSPGNDALLAFAAVCAYADAPVLDADTPAIGFGSVPVGGRATRAITLRDTGGLGIDRLFLETTDLADNFAIAAPCNPDGRACDAAIRAVPANGTTTVVVACTPRTAVGHAAELYAVTAAGARLAAPISLSCTGVPAAGPVVSAVPTAIDVGAVELTGGRAEATIEIRNAGGGQLRLLDAQIVDNGSGAAPDWSYRASSPCQPSVPPDCVLVGEEATSLTVAFDPRAIGVRDATLLVSVRDTVERSLAIPLRGAGRGATLDVVGGHSALDFGTLPIGTQAMLALAIANRGNRALEAGAVELSPTGVFAVSPSTSFTVPAGAATTFTISCRPQPPDGVTISVLRLTAPGVEGDPVEIGLRCAGDSGVSLIAQPPAVLLGEVRRGRSVVAPIDLDASPPAMVSAAVLELPNPALGVTGAPATTPATLELTAEPTSDGDLTNRIMITSSTSDRITVPISGRAVTASLSVPTVVSLGTFCVEQPTTPRLIALRSTGTATIGIAAPVLAAADSPFDLQPVVPSLYPTVIKPGAQASVAVVPKRRAVAGLVSDELTWTTDLDGLETANTRLTATFADNGGAITPSALVFPPTSIHVDSSPAQQVTLQNCDISPLQIGAPQIDAPFSIDSPAPPPVLRPGETVAFSVGFHPTREGDVTRTLVIDSPQLRAPLTVTLTGSGTRGDDDPPFGDFPPGTVDPTSFYACGGCGARGGDAPIALVLAVLYALAPRRRRASGSRRSSSTGLPTARPGRSPRRIRSARARSRRAP